MTTDNPLDFMNANQAAEILQVPVSTLRYWRERGEGPASFKIGKRRVYHRAALEQFVTDQIEQAR